MRKWLGRILSTVSLLLLVVTVGMWVRSQWMWTEVFQTVWIGAGDRPVVKVASLEGYRGSVKLGLHSNTFVLSDPADTAGLRKVLAGEIASRHSGVNPRPLAVEWWAPYFVSTGAERWGFAWEKIQPFEPESAPEPADGKAQTYLRDWSFTAVALPWWFLTLLFTLAPARAVLKWHRRARRRRLRAGLCLHCGYDLRATPEAGGALVGRCPECGRAAGGAGTPPSASRKSTPRP